MTIPRLSILAAGVFVASLTSVAPVAAAPTSAPVDGHTVHVQQDMTVAGFDAAVAEAHGYKIVTLPDGHQASVPATARPGAQPDSQDTAHGNCGYSFVELDPLGHHNVELRTGFGVKLPAVSYTWLVEIQDRAGTSYQHWSGGLRFRSTWSGSRELHLTPPWVDAGVVPGRSSALLEDGEICTSAGPWTFTGFD